jgi:hypothetical protein
MPLSNTGHIFEQLIGLLECYPTEGSNGQVGCALISTHGPSVSLLFPIGECRVRERLFDPGQIVLAKRGTTQAPWRRWHAATQPYMRPCTIAHVLIYMYVLRTSMVRPRPIHMCKTPWYVNTQCRPPLSWRAVSGPETYASSPDQQLQWHLCA